MSDASLSPPADLAHVTDWVFDLDNTLYPRNAEIFGQIDWRMTAYVERLTGLPQDEARALQKRLYRDHGTTLCGLIAEHAIDPQHYLADVHDIDYAAIAPDRALGEAIAALPGRKHIFTNGDIPHALRTLAALGFPDIFDTMFDIVAAGYEPKPKALAYERFIAAHGIAPTAAVMFEDMPRNLEVPKALGMATVLVLPPRENAYGAENWELGSEGRPWIDHVSDDLPGFLRAFGNAGPAR